MDIHKLGKRWYLLAILVLPATLPSVGAAAGGLKVGDVTKDLICQCGCNNVLGVCEMTGWAVPAKALVQEKIDQGLSKEEILAYFVDEYGPKILAAPPKEGFYLTAWIMPFVMIGVGAFLIVFLLRVWIRVQTARGEVELSPLQEMTEEEADKYRKKLHNEIQSWKY